MNAFSSLMSPAAAGAPQAQTLRGGAAADRETMQRKALEFEAMYLAQMLQPMFENLGAAEPFGGGFGEDVWRSMQVQEYGKALAGQGGIGLADAVARELLQTQEAGRGERL